MRYANEQTDLACRVGERRTVRRFLLMPRHYTNSKSKRWLEYADIVEEVRSTIYYQGLCIYYSYGWEEIGFADEMGEKQ